MDVSVILLTRNTCQQTREAIESVFASADTFTKEIHVIDNGSTDKTSSLLPALFPEILYKRMERNVGFARGVNFAARDARGDFLLLLNFLAVASPARNWFMRMERNRTRSPTSLPWRRNS